MDANDHLPVADAQLLRHQGVGCQRKCGIKSFRSHHVGPLRHKQVHEGLVEAKLRAALIGAGLIATEHRTYCMGNRKHSGCMMVGQQVHNNTLSRCRLAYQPRRQWTPLSYVVLG